MTTLTDPPRSTAFGWLAFAMLLAAVVPTQIAYSTPPSGTFFNQAAALLLWGGVVAGLSLRGTASLHSALASTAPLLVALAVLAVAVLSSWEFASLPASLAMSALAVLSAASVMVVSGAMARARSDAPHVLGAFFAAWVVAGALTAIVCLIQVFAPAWTDGVFIGLSSADGRAIGNVRQANHASSLCLWATVALIPLAERGRLRRGPAFALFALMILGVVLTGSRTGLIGVLGLTVWGLLDSRLKRASRALLGSAVPCFALFWLLITAWAGPSGNAFGNAGSARAGLSSSRFQLWLNTLELIGQDPLTGIGFGKFNFAWTLTPFAHRSGEFFDHTHNIVMQLAVELGVPLATLVLAMLGWALWQVGRRCLVASEALAVGLRSAFAMVLIMVLHSQLEYPLWFAFFLLPTAWIWGFGLGLPIAVAEAAPHSTLRRTLPLLIAGLTMVAATGIALADYMKVARIYSATGVEPLSKRIAEGQRSWLFAHHADYAAAVAAPGPAEAAQPLRRAMHFMLDDQLMVTLIRTLAMQGDSERASHVAQRLREFGGIRATEFIAACEAGQLQPPTFCCEVASRPLTWHDFR